MSKSLRASAILITISVGVPSAALATMDGTPEPSSTYTLTVPASDVGDGGSDVPLCFASLGLTDELGTDISEGSANSPEFRPADPNASWDERMDIDGWSHWSRVHHYSRDFESEIGNTPVFSYEAELDRYSIHQFFQDNRPDQWQELDSDQNGFIDRGDPSVFKFDREIFRAAPLVVDWEASNCDDELSGLLTVERGFVQLVGADGSKQDAETDEESLLSQLLARTKKTASAGPYSDENLDSDQIACYSAPFSEGALAIGQFGSEELSPYIKIYDRDRASSYSVGFDFSLVTGIEEDLYADYDEIMSCLNLSY